MLVNRSSFLCLFSMLNMIIGIFGSVMQTEIDGRTSKLTKTVKDVFRYFDESSLKTTRTGRSVPLVRDDQGFRKDHQDG